MSELSEHTVLSTTFACLSTSSNNVDISLRAAKYPVPPAEGYLPQSVSAAEVVPACWAVR
jgi:hypothetical protein